MSLRQKSLVIVARGDTSPKLIMNRLLEEKNIDFMNFSVTKLKNELVLELRLEKPAGKKLIGAIEALNTDPAIKKITWTK